MALFVSSSNIIAVAKVEIRHGGDSCIFSWRDIII